MSESDGRIEHTLTIRAPQKTVWKFLTEPEHVPQWLGCMRYEKTLGHVFYMQQDASKRADDDIDGATHCEILALDEPETFSFSWYVPDTPATTVRIVLAPLDGATEVTLVHEGWEQFDTEAIRAIRDALDGGWRSFVLPNLKRVAEAEIGGHNT